MVEGSVRFVSSRGGIARRGGRAWKIEGEGGYAWSIHCCSSSSSFPFGSGRRRRLMSPRERRSPVKVAFYRRNPGICESSGRATWLASDLMKIWRGSDQKFREREKGEIKRVDIRIIGLIAPSIVQPLNHSVLAPSKEDEPISVEMHRSLQDFQSKTLSLKGVPLFDENKQIFPLFNRIYRDWRWTEFVEDNVFREGVVDPVLSRSKELLSGIETRLGDTDIPCCSFRTDRRISNGHLPTKLDVTRAYDAD